MKIKRMKYFKQLIKVTFLFIGDSKGRKYFTTNFTRKYSTVNFFQTMVHNLAITKYCYRIAGIFGGQ